MNDARTTIASSSITMEDPAITPSTGLNLIRNGYHQIKVEVSFSLYNGSFIPPDIIKQYSTISFLDYDDGSSLSSAGWAWAKTTNGYDAEYNGELETHFDPEIAVGIKQNIQHQLDDNLATLTFFLSTTDRQGRDLGFQLVFDAGSAGYGSGSQTFTVWANGNQQLSAAPHVTIYDPRPYQVTTDVTSNSVDTYPTFSPRFENYSQENTFFVISRSSAYVKDVTIKMDPSPTSSKSGYVAPPVPDTFYNWTWSLGSYIYTQGYGKYQESYYFYIWPIGPQGKAPLYPFIYDSTVTYNDEQAALCVTKIYNHDSGLQQPNVGWYYNCHLTIFDQWGNNFAATIQIDYDNAVAVKMVAGWVQSGRVF